MRPIIFRGKSCTENEWYFGELYTYSDTYFIKMKNGNLGAVIPATIGQFTGLNVIHSTKQVFENDHIIFDADPSKTDINEGIILWYPKKAGFAIFKSPTDEYPIIDDLSKIEILSVHND